VKVNTWSTSLGLNLLAKANKSALDSNGSFTLEECEAIANEEIRFQNFLYFEQPMQKGLKFRLFHSFAR
jgi:hypothetical protein